MSASLASAPVIPSSRAAWWRSRGFWVPLAVLFANNAFLTAWPTIAQRLPIPWPWWNVVYELLDGWRMGYLLLVALWVCFATSHAVVRFPSATAATAIGALLAMSYYGGFGSIDVFRTYYLPQWPNVCLLAAILIAGVHLMLYPTRLLLGWRLDFTPSESGPREARRFQFSLLDLVWLTLATAVALSIVRGGYLVLASRGRIDLNGWPPFLWLTSFGQILIPALACAWLILGRQRQWIGALVLGLAMACPAVVIYAGWHVPLSLGVRELWWAHWMNLGAAACVGLNLLALRLGGLRGVIRDAGKPRRASPQQPGSEQLRGKNG